MMDDVSQLSRAQSHLVLINSPAMNNFAGGYIRIFRSQKGWRAITWLSSVTQPMAR